MNSIPSVILSSRYLAMFAFAASLLAQPIPPAQSAGPDGIAFFEKNIRPVLAGRCYSCHSSAQARPMGGLLLDSRAGVFRGGQSGAPALVPGKPVDAREVENLVAWVKMGAPDPREGAAPAAVPQISSYDWDRARRHWAF